MKVYDVTFLVTVEAENKEQAILLAEDLMQTSSDAYAADAEERKEEAI